MFIYWKLGRLITSNYGAKCKNNGCQESLSRKHVCLCVDAFTQLKYQFPRLDINSDISIVDQALKMFNFEKKHLLKILLLEIVISEIKYFCI